MTVTIWNEATREELRAILPGAVVVLPTAATEQHGPHLATGHDSFAVTAVAERAAAASEVDIVLAPALEFGSSGHHLSFGGTLSLSSSTYLQVMMDLLASIVRSGGRRVFVLNGHGGNAELNQIAVRDTALRQPDDQPVALAAASYWDLAGDALRQAAWLEGVPLPGHAGQFETATMLALDPARVRGFAPGREESWPELEAIAGARLERTGSWQGFDGYTDFPHRATAEDGAASLDLVVREVAKAFGALAGVAL